MEMMCWGKGRVQIIHMATTKEEEREEAAIDG